ncbi:MAG: hypothetical protein RR390_14380, partial [Hafnia sp.]
MNLRQIANNAITSINPNISAILKKYAGETIGPGRKPVPTYLPDQNVTIQLQPISRGIDYVGQVIKPWRRTTRPRTLQQSLTRLEAMPLGDV